MMKRAFVEERQRSVFLPVDWTEPFVKRRSIDDTDEPRPICFGFVPPSVAPSGADAPVSVCESMSANTTRLDLKPVVLMFEMLLPMTSMRV